MMAEVATGTLSFEGTLNAMASDAFRSHASSPCVDFLDRVWTYGEIGEMVERAARGFRDLGVKPGVHVGLCLPNTHYYVVCFFAILRAGGAVVNYNPLYTPNELEYQVNDSRTTIMVTLDVPATLPKVLALKQQSCLNTVIVCSLAKGLPFLKGLLLPLVKRSEITRWTADATTIAFADLVTRGNDAPFPPRGADDLAVLQYTGGTTGVPKGAMLTQGNLYANAAQCAEHAGESADEAGIYLGVLPLFHVFAMTTIMLMGIYRGGFLILHPRFDLPLLLTTMRRKRPTVFPGVPTLYIKINAAKPKPEDVRSLKLCVSGGAPLPIEVKYEFERLTGAKLVEGYGLSEASPVVTGNPPFGLVKAGSIGVVLPGTQIELRDPETGALVEKIGEKGEICVLGPQVMKGYWNRPEDTAACFYGKALRTGDIAYRDEDGYFFIVDRIKDLIICSGYNVYPRAIEEALYQHPAVREAIAIGVPDHMRGQAPKAFVSLREGVSVTPEELMKHLHGHINKIEMPKAVEIRPDLPKTMIGKLSKKELVEEEAAKAAAATQH